MSTRPYVSFKQVKERCSLPDVLEHFGVADEFVRRGETLTGPCPLPGHPANRAGGPRNAQQFKITRKDGVWLWHCFAGDHQIGGDVVRFVQEMLKCDIAHVRLWFAEQFPDRLDLKRPRRDREADKKKASESYGLDDASPAVSKSTSIIDEPQRDGNEEADLKPLRFFLHLDADSAKPYLHHRGIADEVIDRYGLGMAKKGSMKGYVCMPVYRWPKEAAGENPVGYVGRFPGDNWNESEGCSRYKLPKGFPKHLVLYGLHAALEDEQCSYLVVVEGSFSVLRLAAAGHPAVATLGASLSDAQAELLVKTRRNIVFMFDGDEAGLQGARTAAGKLITRAWTRVIKLGDGVQPDELGPDELSTLL